MAVLEAGTLEQVLDAAAQAISSGRLDAAREIFSKARERFPAHVVVYLREARALRDANQHEAADQLLEATVVRFPEDAGAMVDWADNATARRDWPLARARSQKLRARFPDASFSYLIAGRAERLSGNLAEAETLLAEAVERFPRDAGVLFDWADTASRRRDWDALQARCALARERFPDMPAGIIAAARGLRDQGRLSEANAAMAEGVERFPDELWLLVDWADLAIRLKDWEAVQQRCALLRERFPKAIQGYLLAARALRDSGRLEEAEALLEQARAQHSDAIDFWVERGLVATHRRDFRAADLVWTEVRTRAPHLWIGHTAGAQALRELGEVAAAEAVLERATQQLPHEEHPAVEFARHAEASNEWPLAVQRWQTVHQRFPHSIAGLVGLANALRRSGETAAADTLLEATMSGVPDALPLVEQYCLNAVAREDWPLALARLQAGQRRFPASDELRRRLYEVQLRLADSEQAPVIAVPAGPAQDPAASTRELVMQFESLGGGGHGCEFGIFQRAYGAEPLGLLRWTDVYQDSLTAILETEFAGVGDPEFTEIFIPETKGRPEYWTRDTRYHMAMRSFVHVDEVPLERFSRQVGKRFAYLRTKLIDDLHAGEKIFVYKNMKRNLTDAELATLHAAVRRYGENTVLFYIRYADEAHPAGSVELAGPGLMLGNIAHFSHTPDTDQMTAGSHDGFLELCRAGYALWVSTRRSNDA